MTSASTPDSGRLAKFLLSPHFTGILLPAVIMVVGAIYHLTTVWKHQQTEKELREEIRVLRQEKETFESRLKSLEEEVHELQRKAAFKSEKSANFLPLHRHSTRC